MAEGSGPHGEHARRRDITVKVNIISVKNLPKPVNVHSEEEGSQIRARQDGGPVGGGGVNQRPMIPEQQVE